MTKRRPYRLALVVAGAGLLASCTSGGDAEETTPTTVEETTESTSEDFVIAYESPTADDFNKLLVSRDDLTNLQQAEILNVDNGAEGSDGDSSTLVVAFEMESHHCFGVQTGVTESDNEVIVEVLTGHLPEVDPTACEYGIYPYTTELSLQAPIGERTIAPAEPREPTELAEPDSTSTGGISDGTETDPDNGSDTSTGDTTTGGTTTGDTTTGDTTTGDATATTAGDTTAEATPTTAIAPPNEQTGAAAPVAGASSLIGKYVEEGVEWALDNGLEWRVLTFDGVPFAEETPFNAERISFVVEADLIVSLEWS